MRARAGGVIASEQRRPALLRDVHASRRMGAVVALLAACFSMLDPPLMSAQVAYSVVADSARAAPPADVRIPYGSAPQQFAELRLPPGTGPHPVVMLIHGGCWLAQYDLAHVAGIAEALRQAGIATWTIEFRRVGDDGAGDPGTFEDIRAAYDSLLAQGKAHGLDTKRIVLSGHSAGGHLALWLAGERGVTVRGTVGLAAITDLAAYAQPTGCGAGITQLLGGTPVERADVFTARSPVSRAKASGVVTLVVATEDRIVPRAQADAYLARFPNTRVVEEPGGHFDVVAPWTTAWRAALDAIRELMR
ncbi:MAG: alpha/beta hydrolase [Gemmatimonadaceae bacterium]|nr:alpha/beta hydrolase [Gemmatimonadaceae bacterium]